jgi:hypothetical protein
MFSFVKYAKQLGKNASAADMAVLVSNGRA